MVRAAAVEVRIVVSTGSGSRRAQGGRTDWSRRPQSRSDRSIDRRASSARQGGRSRLVTAAAVEVQMEYRQARQSARSRRPQPIGHGGRSRGPIGVSTGAAVGALEAAAADWSRRPQSSPDRSIDRRGNRRAQGGRSRLVTAAAVEVRIESIDRRGSRRARGGRSRLVTAAAVEARNRKYRQARQSARSRRPQPSGQGGRRRGPDRKYRQARQSARSRRPQSRSGSGCRQTGCSGRDQGCSRLDSPGRRVLFLRPLASALVVGAWGVSRPGSSVGRAGD